jgi:beta-glucosidase
MADRVAHVIWAKPRRRVGFGVGLAVFVAAVVLLASGLSTASPAASTSTASAVAANQQAIAGKVDSLISRMTVAEKFGQLEMAGPSTPTGSDLIPLAEQGQIGSVLDLTGVDNINAVQAAAVGPQSRLHIPLIFGLDVIHGYKTLFPVPIGEASSWDPALVQNDEAVSAAEATADGIKWTFNPMVDIARDPRWGRVVEGAGEDPFLASAIAAAKVRGYQGSDFSVADKMAATIKHFAAYGAPVAGREYNTV